MALTGDKYDCNDPRLRPVEAAHIGELIRIGEETNLSPWSAQSYLEEMKNENSIMLRLVDEDNLIIGFVVGRIVAGGDVEKRVDAEIYNIAVIDAQQRTGCGQTLFDAFKEICSKRDAANIWLEVRESNEKAIKFYERNGFTRVQTRNHFYENPREHAILMRLDLE
jgi:[ribosomal protein S18]-alanine N-acetyltransferase